MVNPKNTWTVFVGSGLSIPNAPSIAVSGVSNLADAACHSNSKTYHN